MVLKVEHELHARKRGQNRAVLLLLLAFIAMVFGLTVVKVQSLGDLGVGDRMEQQPNFVDGPAQPRVSE